jgi:hypothetical protein
VIGIPGGKAQIPLARSSQDHRGYADRSRCAAMTTATLRPAAAHAARWRWRSLRSGDLRVAPGVWLISSAGDAWPALEVHRLLAMNAMDPADCLRSLTAEALAWAHPQRSLFPVSLRLMAVANALVMLGLLPEPQAEAIFPSTAWRSRARAWGTAGG